MLPRGARGVKRPPRATVAGMIVPGTRWAALALMLLVGAEVQAQSKPPLVGVLMTLAYPTRLEAFRAGLASLGYEEGRTITSLGLEVPPSLLVRADRAIE